MLTIAIPFCEKDQQYALSLIRWIRELGGCPSHNLLLVSPDTVDADYIQLLLEEASGVFSHSSSLRVKIPEGKDYHPYAPSLMFLKTAEHVWLKYKTPWQWLETDMIPLRPRWADALESEYDRTPLQVLGTIIWPGRHDAHVTGCALYPNNAWCWMQEYESHNLDIPMDSHDGMAKHLLPITQHTESYQHLHVCREQRVVAHVKNSATEVGFDRVRRDALFFHYDKTHSMLPLMRDRLGMK